jgi:hypothetical protein
MLLGTVYRRRYIRFDWLYGIRLADHKNTLILELENEGLKY